MYQNGANTKYNVLADTGFTELATYGSTKWS
jgi:hypothetical protein